MMFKNVHSLLALLFCCTAAFSQSRSILQRVLQRDTTISIYTQGREGKYIVAAALNNATRTIYLISRYGSVVDSFKMTVDDYQVVKHGDELPFTYCRKRFDQQIGIGMLATQQLVSKGRIDERWEYGAVMNEFLQTSSHTATAFSKLAVIDAFCNDHLYHRWLLDCKEPDAFMEDSTTLYTNNELVNAGSIIIGSDTVVYYNKNLLSGVYKAVVLKQKATILFFDRDARVMDSLALHRQVVAQLLKNKTDVFLYYRCWLGMLENATHIRIAWLEKANRENPSALVQYVNYKLYRPAIIVAALKKELQRLDTLITNAAYPSAKMMATVLHNYYKDREAYTPLLTALGMGYQLVSTRGNKTYELTDHRGNVMAVISDKKIAHSSNGSTFDYYKADVLSATDYYPFGMVSRSTKTNTSAQYRFGFNGKENDNEVKGEGNQQDYGMRIYDPRLGRFLSVDPLTKGYPQLTPYQFASNSPINSIDVEGAEATEVIHWVANVGTTRFAAKLATPTLISIFKITEKQSFYVFGFANGFYSAIDIKGLVQGLQNDQLEAIKAVFSSKFNTFLQQGGSYESLKTLLPIVRIAEEAYNNLKREIDLAYAGDAYAAGQVHAICLTALIGGLDGTEINFLAKLGPNGKKAQQILLKIESKPSEARVLLNRALERQKLKDIPSGLKEEWSENGYDFEVRIHDADPNAPEGSNSKNGPTFRVARRLQGKDSNGQGFGWEYADDKGNWHKQRDLKSGKNSQASDDTHIPIKNR